MERIQGDPAVPGGSGGGGGGGGISAPKNENRTQNECISSFSDDGTLAKPYSQSISSRVDKSSTTKGKQRVLEDEFPAHTPVSQAGKTVILASSGTAAPETPPSRASSSDVPITTTEKPDPEESADSVLSRADTVFSKSTTNSPSTSGASPFPSSSSGGGEPSSSPAADARGERSRSLLSPSPYHTALRITKRGRAELEAVAENGPVEFDVEQEERAAVEQADEDGSIVIDHDDMSSDAGYASDANTTCSTSLAESIRDYVFENGRRYHRFREGRYNFPNDDVEQQREDMKHAMVKMLCGRLYYAPIGNHPQEILDIGTGTGIWCIEMGDIFESANILGVDLSPIQPEWVPPNVRFMVDDVESPWLHPRNYFDYIHARHTVMGIKDWPRLMRRTLEHLRPGGWFEMQEVVHFPNTINGPMPPDHPLAQYWALVREGLAALGVDFHAAAGGNLVRMMREAGYENVTERVLQIPIGTWPKNKVLKTVGLYWRTILLDGIQAIALGPMTRGLRWSREQVEMFLIQVRKAYHDNSALLFMPLHIVCGQKPAVGGY
ncbi:S-adenosyl-L-methionine-dependent methyltransferase [Sordaria brevicollis]|uniref:S-adenosyl-L-methionine-dependent methyltransferase n=1 Tax=Sordaria brevicollis TaxID=83679 RepID=A0AAE0U9Y2_SORBR|nr:S-adenosyl-L-methionine-dependent methyltransferase [Sordaria brevicollis]